MDRKRAVRLQHAVALKKDRQLAAAQRELEELITEDPNDTYALANLAHTLLLRGRKRDALETADRALESAPDDAFLAWIRGDALYRLRRWEEAASALRAAVDGGFDSAWTYGRLGDAYARSGDADGARGAVEKGLTAHPGDAKLLVRLGRIERASGDEQAAQHHIEEAARRAPDDAYIYKEMIATRAKGKGDRAVDELERLLKIPSQAKNPHLHDELARLRSDARDHSGAVDAARRALELDPASRRFRQRLGHALVRAKQDDEAVEIFELGLADDPENPTLHRSYIAAQRRRHRLDDAQAFYHRLLDERPDAKKLHGWLRRLAREESTPTD